MIKKQKLFSHSFASEIKDLKRLAMVQNADGWIEFLPVRKGRSSVLVLSTPSARAIVDNFLILFNRNWGCAQIYINSDEKGCNPALNDVLLLYAYRCRSVALIDSTGGHLRSSALHILDDSFTHIISRGFKSWLGCVR